MSFEDLLQELLKLPNTLEEATEFVRQNPMMQATVSEMAFKQTVINLLIAAGLVSENDFNASVEHFKRQLYDEFGKELLREADAIRREAAADDDDEDLDEEQNDVPPSSRPLPQA